MVSLSLKIQCFSFTMLHVSNMRVQITANHHAASGRCGMHHLVCPLIQLLCRPHISVSPLTATSLTAVKSAIERIVQPSMAVRLRETCERHLASDSLGKTRTPCATCQSTLDQTLHFGRDSHQRQHQTRDIADARSGQGEYDGVL